MKTPHATKIQPLCQTAFDNDETKVDQISFQNFKTVPEGTV